MSNTKFYKGRPVEGEALDELLKNWPIPDVTEDPRKYSGRSTAFGKPLEQVYQKPDKSADEPDTDEPEFPTLTLEELEQIRQDAYDEGIKQGHEQGYIDGFDKGVTEGKEAGYKEGVEIGKQQGHDDAKPLIEEKLQTLTLIVNELHEPLRLVDERCEKQLVELANLLAQAVIFREVELDPNIVLLALKKAMDALPISEQTVKIHLHPDDLELVKEAYGEEQLAQQHWHLLPEPTLHRGDVEVKTSQSSIDMTLKTRIKEILDDFLHGSGIQS
ncbi:flagellar assembly protein FliH [Pseudoalteromonas sp. MMG022]|uniref:flagellar assembly protein FliH n=1 Tax=Pseudoalteromonas sp. MMG022 TaxID=2909978 RepID=UPI001F177E30|nr:flagellar assembly protein FliH [Pseudoalteromonas sp. MMG022]MCF6434713.1 flagellar assembly protein FliH [Pseudoalteromonas sp. MMG022]